MHQYLLWTLLKNPALTSMNSMLVLAGLLVRAGLAGDTDTSTSHTVWGPGNQQPSSHTGPNIQSLCWWPNGFFQQGEYTPNFQSTPKNNPQKRSGHHSDISQHHYVLWSTSRMNVQQHGRMAGQNNALSIDCDSSSQWETTVTAHLWETARGFKPDTCCFPLRTSFHLSLEGEDTGRDMSADVLLVWPVCVKVSPANNYTHFWCDTKWPRRSKGTVMQRKDRTRLNKKTNDKTLQFCVTEETTSQSSNCSGANIVIRIECWLFTFTLIGVFIGSL